MNPIDRRNFNLKLSRGLAGAFLAGNLPVTHAMCMAPNQKRGLGVALVGLGSYSTYQLAPALQLTEHCHLAGIVTGTPSKAEQWARQYGLDARHIYDYSTFDRIADDDAIDIVYVVLPNSMHAEFTIRAARAGKHVICEKPMAMSVKECDAMLKACQQAGVKLGMGYRLHSEPYTREIKRLVREKVFGEVRFVIGEAAYISSGNPGQWRLNKALSGGGALMNMGVYAIQSCIYGSGRNPVAVSAQEFSTRPDYFKDTDETIAAQLTFPEGAVGTVMTSHNANANRLYGSCDSGWFELQPANNYGPLAGQTSRGVLEFAHEPQQKLQMDDFARHILEGSPNRAPGEMGRRDMVIVEAIYRSIREGGRMIPVELPPGYGLSE